MKKATDMVFFVDVVVLVVVGESVSSCVVLLYMVSITCDQPYVENIKCRNSKNKQIILFKLCVAGYTHMHSYTITFQDMNQPFGGVFTACLLMRMS